MKSPLTESLTRLAIQIDRVKRQTSRQDVKIGDAAQSEPKNHAQLASLLQTFESSRENLPIIIKALERIVYHEAKEQIDNEETTLSINKLTGSARVRDFFAQMLADPCGSLLQGLAHYSNIDFESLAGRKLNSNLLSSPESDSKLDSELQILRICNFLTKYRSDITSGISIGRDYS